MQKSFFRLLRSLKKTTKQPGQNLPESTNAKPNNEELERWQKEEAKDFLSSEKLLSIPQSKDGFSPPLFFPNENYKKGSSAGHILIRQAFWALRYTTQSIGWKTTGEHLHQLPTRKQLKVINWSDKVCYGPEPARLYIEHGWLPRWTYQISPTGTNATSHVAKSFSQRKLSDLQIDVLTKQLDNLRTCFAAQVRDERLNNIRHDIDNPFILCAFQLANDTNLRDSCCDLSSYYSTEETANVSFAKAFVDLIYQTDPPLPVLFKQHPVDKSDLSCIKLRPSDKLLHNDMNYSAHELFASGLCRLVIAVNSNTLHESSVWRIPAVALGSLVWHEKTVACRPYPSRLELGYECIDNPQTNWEPLLLYLQHLIENQWTLNDLMNPAKVKHLLERSNYVPNSFSE